MAIQLLELRFTMPQDMDQSMLLSFILVVVEFCTVMVLILLEKLIMGTILLATLVPILLWQVALQETRHLSISVMDQQHLGRQASDLRILIIQILIISC